MFTAQRVQTDLSLEGRRAPAQGTGLISMPATEPTQLLHFDIIETLGSGGNGTVYRAKDGQSGEVVALKTLKNANDVTLNRFKREFLSLKKMENAGIVRVHHGFFDHDPPFFSMEWVKGKTLSEMIEDMEDNPMVFTVADRENFALRLGIQVCDILTYIHAFGEVHRDLKPDNIFVTVDGSNILSEFTIKMLDFGLLKQVDEPPAPKVDEALVNNAEDTQGGMIVGTVHYLSPEQAKGTRVDPRSDLYSLGVILYRIISLRLPYASKDVVGYIFKTVFEDPEPIGQHTPDCSAAVQELLGNLLSKEIQKRPHSAEDLGRRFKEILEPPPTVTDIQASDLDLVSGIEGFGSPLLPPPMVGREEAIAAMVRQVDSVEKGQPHALILIGEPGMGRTSVIKEWKARIQFKKPVVLQAHFPEEQMPAQDPIGTLLDTLIRTLKPEEVKSLFRDIYPFLIGPSRYLSRYFDVKSIGKFDHLSPGRKLQVLALNFIKLLKRLNERGPVVMILDDVHQASERFLGWLTLLWEQLDNLRFLLVFSCSPDPAKATATPFRHRLEEAPETLAVPLDPLNRLEIIKLLHAMLPIGVELKFSSKLGNLIMERTNGNPFYATELFSRLYEDKHLAIEKGVLDLCAPGEIDVPLSIHQALLKKVRRLDTEALQLLQYASVFGINVPYRSLVHCLPWPEERWMPHLTRLLKMGVLREESEPSHRLCFNAPALQKVLYQEITTQARQEAHERAARAMEPYLSPGDMLTLEQVAYHYAQSQNHVRAIKYAYLAGNSALEAKEMEKAVYFFQLSLSMMDQMQNQQARNLVNLKLAEVFLDNHQPVKALVYYTQSLGEASRSKMEMIRALRGRMLCFRQMNKLTDALADAERLREVGKAFSPRIQAESLVARGKLAWLAKGQAITYSQDLAQAHKLYPKLDQWEILQALIRIHANQLSLARKEVKQLVAAKFEPSLPVHLLSAALLYFSGQFAKAMDHLNLAKQAMTDASATIDPHFMIAHALLTYKLQSTLAPDHSAEEYLSIAKRYVDRFDLDTMHFTITIVHLEHLLLSGRLQEAQALVDEVAQAGTELPNTYFERNLFLCLAVRTAWEKEERVPRKWLLEFRELELPNNAPFILQTHHALALTSEALLPLATTGAKAMEKLRLVGELLVKLKLKYYYRAVLGKQIALAEKLGSRQLDSLRQLKEKIDSSLGVQLSG